MSVFSETFKINKHWADYISKTSQYKYNWCIGAYRSSKSVSNTLAFALYLETTPDKLHLVIASTVASARAIVEDGDGRLGLRQYFAGKYKQTKYKGYDAGIISTPTGKKTVVYLGGSMESSFKCFRGWSVGSVVLEELNLLHQNTIDEAKGRTFAAHNPKYFMSMNPTNSKHPVYSWLRELKEKNLVNLDRSTIYDNPALSEERKAAIIGEFDPDSIFYKQYILGEDVDAEGQIFRIYDYTVINEFDINDYNHFITVADPGQTISATTFILAAYNYKTRSMDVLREFGWKNKIKGNVVEKHANQLAKDFIQFNQECIDLMKGYPSIVIIDGYYGHDFFDNAIIESRNAGLNLNIKTPVNSEGKSGKDPDDIRITKTSSLLYQGKLRFLNTCRGCINDISTLQYDMKELEKGKIKILEIFTEDGHADYADCVFYAQSYFRNFLL